MAKTKRQTKYVPGKRGGSPEKIQAYGEELERLAQEHGGVTPELVVEIAERPEHVFHDYFEWDDVKASRLYHLDQARHLIRLIEVEVRYDGKGRQPKELEVLTTTRAFQHVERDGDARYQHYDIVSTTEAFREQVHERFAKEAQRLAREMSLYKHLRKYTAMLLDISVGLRGRPGKAKVS